MTALPTTTFTEAPVDPSDCDSVVAKVDQLFAEWDNWDSPGAALAVVKDGAIVYKRGYGCANLEYNIPITPSTIFHVASVSKQFTAFAIALLAQQGRLSLDDDVRQHLPEVPDLGKTITIRHLIHHISGLRDQWELLAMAGWRLDDVITKEHILKMVRHQQDLNFAPGEEHLYCNTGYTLMAEIVERVTSQSFGEYTAASIFKPLGMASTHFHDDHEMIVKNRAYSYASDEERGFRKSVLSFANAGATSLFTTVKDLTRWAQNFDDARVGGVAVIEQMHQQGILNNGKEISYAFGLVIGEHGGLRTVSHSGGDAGYRSHLVRFPDQRIAIAILSNLSTFNPASLALQVAEVYLADQFPPAAAKETAVPVDPVTYDVYIGHYFSSLGLLRISREDEQLMAQVMEQLKRKLLFESEDRFSIAGVGVQVSFQRDETGQVTQLTIHQSSRDMVAKRVEPLSLTPEQLAEFMGDYYSDELGTTYTMTVKDDRLVVRHRRHDDVPLTPIVADQFASTKWPLGNIHFMRDENEGVTGFKLSSERIRNLRFDK